MRRPYEASPWCMRSNVIFHILNNITDANNINVTDRSQYEAGTIPAYTYQVITKLKHNVARDYLKHSHIIRLFALTKRQRGCEFPYIIRVDLVKCPPGVCCVYIDPDTTHAAITTSRGQGRFGVASAPSNDLQISL